MRRSAGHNRRRLSHGLLVMIAGSAGHSPASWLCQRLASVNHATPLSHLAVAEPGLVSIFVRSTFSALSLDIRESRISAPAPARAFTAWAGGWLIDRAADDCFQGFQSQVRRRRSALFPLLQSALRQPQLYGGLTLRKIARLTPSIDPLTQTSRVSLSAAIVGFTSSTTHFKPLVLQSR